MKKDSFYKKRAFFLNYVADSFTIKIRVIYLLLQQNQ